MAPTSRDEQSGGSFRDPDGFVFIRAGAPHRRINRTYREAYHRLMDSGLYAELCASGKLIPHEEVPPEPGDEEAYRILRPEAVPFISYPHEWCFSQLKDAALLTLDIQEKALAAAMSLKDASAYNVQFRDAKPVFIDTLSFEAYREGGPWPAYRQFCQHFLAPLALMAMTDVRLGGLFRLFIDGVPLDMAAAMLPLASRFKPGLLLHVHLHAKSQKVFAGGAPTRIRSMRIRKSALVGLVQSLRSAVKGLEWRDRATEWGGYYRDNSYTEAALASKGEAVRAMLAAAAPASLWDLGANNGFFSRMASSMGIRTLSFDLDHAAVEAGYLQARDKGERGLLPLVLDLTNPSPAMGWANRERFSLLERGPADAAMALALVHHLAISNNVPLERIAAFLRSLCRVLVIEFVPKEDVQVRRLLATRPDIFPDYHEEGFLSAFARHFRVRETRRVSDSTRTLYLMEGA
jgi:hypothetical protein